MSNVKDLAKEWVGRSAENKMAWFAYRQCGRLSHYLGQIYGHARWSREINHRDALLEGIIQDLFPDLTVSSGPFRGMRYPSRRSVGSALLPKLLGSYESELHVVLEQLLRIPYTSVVDVGCAEGYYAVGLARRLPSAQVYAFDIDLRAREACSDMARLNGVAERVHIAGACDTEALRSLPLGDKALLIVDCEGYEKKLLTAEVTDLLSRHDLIVETHDFLDIEISRNLRSMFAGTHLVQTIRSTDDIEKAHGYDYEKLAKFSTAQKRLILAERRPAIMEWLVMTPLLA